MLQVYRLLLAVVAAATIGSSYAAFEGLSEVRTIVESSAVKSLNVTLGVADVWQLKVGGNPTTGYGVILKNCDTANDLSKVLQPYLGSGRYVSKKTGLIGSGGYYVFMFRATEPGQTCVLIEWKKPSDPVVESVAVNVTVTPKSLEPDATGINMMQPSVVAEPIVWHRTIDESSAVKSLNITLGVGEVWQLKVGGNPTTGNGVILKNCDTANDLSKVLQPYLGSGRYVSKKTGLIGSGGYYVFMFRATEPGQTCVLIEWKRPRSPNAESFAVNVTVTPKSVNGRRSLSPSTPFVNL